jgi:iron complex outermembrane recepter protein
MITKTLSALHRCLAVGVLLVGLVALTSPVNAQAPATGVVEGRVLNESTGRYLNNARVRVVGTNLEATTNADGYFAIANVPAGEVTIAATFVGFTAAQSMATVPAGGTVGVDLTLGAGRVGEDGVVMLDPLSVEAVAMSGMAVAMTEQRNAPNIKNVISLDEFVDMADGNVGEFLKFVPGLDISYNPFFAANAQIRGMPSSGTLVQFDGVSLAASAVAGGRTFDLNTAANANIDRIEVSKVPTPDMPANAVGGSINVISKSGFTTRKPRFDYNLYTTYNGNKGQFNPSFTKAGGPDRDSTLRPAQLAYSLSYLHPIQNKVALSLALSRAPRYQTAHFIVPNWDLNQLRVGSQYLGDFTSFADAMTIKAGIDWKVGKHGMLQFSHTDTQRDSITRHSRVRWLTAAGTRSGDRDTTIGTGAAQQDILGNHQYRSLDVSSLIYRHDGPVWRADAHASVSNGGFKFTDMSDGIFASLLAATPNNNYTITGHDGIYRGRIPDITATAVAGGAPVNIFDGNIYPITNVTTNERNFKNRVKSGGFNLGREFDTSIPTTVRVGFYFDENSRDSVGGVGTYLFRPNGLATAAARTASNFDLIVPAYTADRRFVTNSGQRVNTKFISLNRVYQLYQENPSWFVLDETAYHINSVNASQELTETITAGYIRLDHRLLDNRLRLTYGARYEHTEDDGAGPKNDIAATYQRNPDGSFVRNNAGNLVPITTNALERARLQYVERGTRKKTDYDGIYPSLNMSYDLGQYFVVRAGYARTIGRPDLNQIIPSVTISDPANADATSFGTIRVVDGLLDPWTANNFDLTLESYDFKGATVGVSLYHKDISKFFTTFRGTATPDLLAEVGLPVNFLEYDVIRTINSGNATVQGVELSWRQSFSFLDGWARRFHVFANLSSQEVTGPNARDFQQFAEKMASGGISYIHPKYQVKLNFNYQDWLKLSQTAGGQFTMLAPSMRWDFSAQYRFSRRLSVYCSIRNLTFEPQKRSVVDSSLPSYTYPRDWRWLAAAYSVGIKGTF